MGRTIIVGDVHGCLDELERLLAAVQWTEEDSLFFVGDLASRGPDPLGVMDCVRRTHARAVLGNHEESLLRWLAARNEVRSAPKLGPSVRALADAMSDADWELLEQLPLFLDLPQHELRIVHAGLVPDVPMAAQARHVLLCIRHLSEHGEPLSKREPEAGAVLWATRYQGPPHVVFGHNAQPKPQIHAWATGIDTGAVYGNRLTAMVLALGQKVPPMSERESVLVSVPSTRCYYVARVHPA